MNCKFSHAPASRSLRKSVITRTITLSCLLLAANATAQVLVTDAPAETSAHAAVVKQIAQYAKQLEQLSHEVNTDVQTLETYQALMASIENVINNPIGALIPPNTNMPHLSQGQIDGLVQYQCNNNGSSGSLVGDAIGSLVNAINLGGSNLMQSQQQVCAGIVVAQSDAYNATADLYNQMPQFHRSLSGLNDMMNTINNVSGGNASAQATTFSDQQKQAITDWQARTGVDENVVKSLRAQQQTLAKIAIRGNPGLAGEAVQTAAFIAAFQD